ncbi:hypothetical protein ACH4KU_19925 [Streptomyces althioticus]|uniref:hypothetical protein n=1 Tax=Streptomyces althioticus TaxID=83380 RepID=UPI0033DA0C7F
MHFASLPSQRACARPDSPCLSDETVGTLTDQAFATRVEAASRVLATHGVARGTVVAVGRFDKTRRRTTVASTGARAVSPDQEPS